MIPSVLGIAWILFQPNERDEVKSLKMQSPGFCLVPLLGSIGTSSAIDPSALLLRSSGTRVWTLVSRLSSIIARHDSQIALVPRDRNQILPDGGFHGAAFLFDVQAVREPAEGHEGAEF